MQKLLHKLRQIFTPVKWAWTVGNVRNEIKLPIKSVKVLGALKMNLEDKKKKWMAEEEILRQKLVCLEDKNSLENDLKYPLKIAGADLSFLPNDANQAACCYVVLQYENDEDHCPEIVWQDVKFVKLDLPYVPGLLAFREAQPVIDMINRQKELSPVSTPDYLMIDGNGLLHPRRAGLACHIGVGVDLPTIGVAKNLFVLDAYFDDERGPKAIREDYKKQIKELDKAGRYIEIAHPEGNDIVGMILLTRNSSISASYVSIGHRVSLARCKEIVLRTAKFKNPEPVRQADLIGREFVKEYVSKTKKE